MGQSPGGDNFNVYIASGECRDGDLRDNQMGGWRRHGAHDHDNTQDR